MFPTMSTEAQASTTSNAGSQFLQICSLLTNHVIGIVIFLLVTVFPLIFHHSYYDILEVKYQSYRFCILLLMSLLLLLLFGMLFIDLERFHGQYTKRFFSKLHPSVWKTSFCTADAAVLAFWLTAGISTLQSDFVHAAFWGDEGRYSGLFLLSLYVISYFIIAHFWKFNGIFLELFLASGMLICLFGITDYFRLDILHFRTDAHAVSVMMSFTSTIGNINTYTAYISMILGISATLFALEKKPLKQIWYYLCLVISLFAIIMGRSDNAYLSLAALFALLPFLLFSDRQGIQKYLIIVATFFTVAQIIVLLNQRYAGIVIGLDGLFSYAAHFRGLFYVVLLLWIAVIIFRLCPSKLKSSSALSSCKTSLLLKIWGGILLLSLLVLLFLLFDVNAGGHAERYGSLRNYLLFNDSWGSSRGYIWKTSLQLYRKLPLNQKLFGCGPDTFGLILSETQHASGSYLDNAHNAFLQYFVTIGLFGLVTYTIFFGICLRQLFKRKSQTPYIPAILTAVSCYLFQSLVNLDVPVVTPILWLLISMGIAGCRTLSQSSSVKAFSL